MLTTADKVREIIGLSEVDAPDTDLDVYIVKAQKRFRNDIAIWIRDDTLTWESSDNCSTFNLTYKWIFDKDYDGSITVNDIDVYKWTTANSIDTRSVLTLSSINSIYGFVVTTNPVVQSGNVVVTASYYFYPTDIDTDLVSEAIANLAGFLYVKKEMLLIPDHTSHGAYRMSFSKPWNDLYNDYLRIKEGLLATPMIVGKHGDVTLIREELS